MKNIIIVIDSLSGGGAERVMISLATELVKQGHRLTILSLSNRCDYDVPADITVACLFNHKASKVDRFWLIKSSVKRLESWFSDERIKNGPCDLVLSNLDRSNNLLSLSNVPAVYYVVHNSVTEELNRQKKLGPLAYWYLLKSKKNLTKKKLISVSKGIAKEIKAGNVIVPSEIQTIYNPFDIEAIKEKASIKNEAIPKEPYIIHVGRLAKQKRHDVLFAAFAKVSTNVNLVLLCNKPDKALTLAKKYGIEDRIILPGFQSNPYNWIKQAQALILSSDYEGLPTVLLEAIAVNTKVVSTNCPHGPNEILTGDLAKYLVPRRKPEQLAQAINQVLSDDVKLEDAEILTKVSAKNIASLYLSLTSI